MTTRYQKSQIEDVARILHKYYLGIAYGPGYSAGIAGDFADLFAADNPPRCSTCGASVCSQRGHVFASGFDRERFLTACGLKSEG